GIALPACAALALLNFRLGLWAVAACCVALALGIGLFEWFSGGWFSFYTFTVASGHRIDPVMHHTFWQTYLLKEQGLVAAASLLALLHLARQNRRIALFYAVLLLSAVVSIYAACLHKYGFLNNLMPMHAIFALVAGLGFVSMRGKWALASGFLIAAQMAMLCYDPWPLVPKPKMTQYGETFLKVVGEYEGESFMPDLQFVSETQGKKSWSYGMAAYDLLRADLKEKNPLKTKLIKELETAIAEEKFGVIIPGRLVHRSLPGLNEHYRPRKRMQFPEGYALDSLNSRDMLIYTPIHKKVTKSHDP
ncbi:MAG: hypothetical protein K2Q01_12525, partial [Rickettsiales bacterium]|nr:hypothetical protein [Rickettsiales bacterium]